MFQVANRYFIQNFYTRNNYYYKIRNNYQPMPTTKLKYTTAYIKEYGCHYTIPNQKNSYVTYFLKQIKIKACITQYNTHHLHDWNIFN